MTSNKTQIIIALIGLVGVIATVVIPNCGSIFPTNGTDPNGEQITVLSVNHASETVGKYFNFDVADADKILKNQTWKKSILEVKHVRSNRTGKVVIWREANGGFPGDGHGRWDNGTAKPGDWETGDIVLVTGIIE